MLTSPGKKTFRRTTGRAVRIFCTDTGVVLDVATVTGVRNDYRTGRKLIDTDTGRSYSLATFAECSGGTTRFEFAD